MATTFSSNYYPPIVDTYLPAFEVVNNNFTVRIYFALSPYTDFLHSRYMHIKVVDQQTNENALVYNSGLKLNAVVKIDDTRQGEDIYYVELKSTEFKNFEPFRYYKVQLRSCAAASSNNDSIGSLYKDTAIYSEWSTVCLIKGITKPILKIKYFNNTNSDNGVLFNSNTIIVRGGMVFTEEENNNKLQLPENIKSYSIKFYDDGNRVIDNSGDLYPPTTNLRAISYDAKYLFNPKIQYKMEVNITTTSYFNFKETFLFSVNENTVTDAFQGFITKDIDNGVINIHVTKITENQIESVLYIRRTDSNSNFTVWEDIYSIDVPAAEDPGTSWVLDWKDCTIESGVWYKYGIQSISIKTNKIRTNNKILQCQDISANQSLMLHKDTEVWDKDQGIVSSPAAAGENSDTVMLIFEDSFLVGKNGQQLKITYDNTLDSLKYSQYISKIDTIGSKYPFIRQNSASCYRIFGLSGLITVLTDDDQLFIKDNDLFINEAIKELYNQYNSQNNVTEYDDYIKEREFREAVMAFLIADDVKLFRSTTEGNVLIKLMDVSFSPKQELGRYIYSFSATAVECGDCTIDNFMKYKIQRASDTSYDLITDLLSPTYKIDTSSLELNECINTSLEVEAMQNLKDIIMDSYNNQEIENTEGYKLIDVQPYLLTLEFLDSPYTIDTSTLQPAENGESGWLFTLTSTDNVSQTYFVSKNMKSFTFSKSDDESPLTFYSLTFPKNSYINVIVDAALLYEKQTYAVQQIDENTGEVTWVPVDDPEQEEESSMIGGIVQYTSYQVVQLNSEKVENVWLNKNLVSVAESILSDSYEIDPSANIEIKSFSCYSFLAQGFPIGTVIKVTYNDNNELKFILQKTGSIDINVDDNSEDQITTIQKVEIIGQLLSDISGLSEPNYYLSNNPNIVQINGSWQWITGETISFYSDLSLNTTVAKANAYYGVINNDLDITSIPTIDMLVKTGIQEGSE